MSVTAATTPAVHETEQKRKRLRVLLVPDSIHWITGTIAQSIVRHNPWIDGTIVSGPVLDMLGRENPALFDAFDVVHFLCPYSSRAWLPVLRERVACVTSHHHVSDDWGLLRHNLDGDAIIVGSPQWAEDVIARGAVADRVIYVPYGVEVGSYLPPSPEERRRSRGALGVDNSAITVGFFAKRSSNENDRKGTDVFAEAIRLLGRDLSGLVALIVGPGWHELVEELESAGVKCVWLPFVRSSAEMAGVYRALDFYWVTARVEGGPVTLLEAMSSGVCCITTRVGLAREIVDDAINAVLVPFDDARAVASRTLELALDPDRRRTMGEQARSTILETMDAAKTSQRVRIAYDIARKQFVRRAGRIGRVSSSLAEAYFSSELSTRVRLLEQLSWAEALMLQGQRSIAIRMILRAWADNPTSAKPLRYLLRNLLPGRAVAALVRANRK